MAVTLPVLLLTLCVLDRQGRARVRSQWLPRAKKVVSTTCKLHCVEICEHSLLLCARWLLQLGEHSTSGTLSEDIATRSSPAVTTRCVVTDGGPLARTFGQSREGGWRHAALGWGVR